MAALYITERYPAITLSLYHLITLYSYPVRYEFIQLLIRIFYNSFVPLTLIIQKTIQHDTVISPHDLCHPQYF